MALSFDEKVATLEAISEILKSGKLSYEEYKALYLQGLFLIAEMLYELYSEDGNNAQQQKDTNTKENKHTKNP